MFVSHEWEFPGNLFVNIDSQTGTSTAVQITSANAGRTRHHLVDHIGKVILLLDPKSWNRHVYVIGGLLVHRIVIATFLPNRTHAEVLAWCRNLLGLSDASDPADATEVEVDQRSKIRGPHSKGWVKNSPMAIEVFVCALMVRKCSICLDIRIFVKCPALVTRFRDGYLHQKEYNHHRHRIRLDAYVAKALFLPTLSTLSADRLSGPAGMSIQGYGVAQFSAQELLDSHVGALAFDVPQSHVERWLDDVGEGAIAPVEPGVATATSLRSKPRPFRFKTAPDAFRSSL